MSRQDVRIAAGPGAALEWLAQETLLYNDACVEMAHDVYLAPDARYLGSEILCFGRTASGEAFTRGAVRQATRRHHDRLRPRPPVPTRRFDVTTGARVPGSPRPP